LLVRHINIIHRQNRVWCELIERNRRVKSFELSAVPACEDMTVPDGFLRISDAAHRLAKGIWGGVPRPAPLRDISPELKRGVSLGFGPWKEKAGQLLSAAATEGKLTVYVFAGAANNNLDPNPVALPRAVLSSLIPVRGGLPYRPNRRSTKIAGGDLKILGLLRLGVLLVCTEEFNQWYRSERNKGKWPSQRFRKKRREGRPSKQTDSLRNAVMKAMREEKTTIAGLRRRLAVLPLKDVPSLDTLERMVDQLYLETGEPTLRRTRRLRRNRV
jgi:hypothetical protein